MPRKPMDSSAPYDAEPIKIQPMTPRMGRPPKLPPAPMPDFEMSPDEQYIFRYFIDAIKADYPKLAPSDLLLLPICAAEYVKYLRMLQREMKSGELVTMSRQHPGTMFARFMAQLLGTTRASRLKNKPEDPEDAFDWSKLA